MPLLMPLNLLCPFQTGPGAVQLRANPEAACHVAALLIETCECRRTEKTVTLKRFVAFPMNPLDVTIEIESVPKTQITGLTLEAT